MNSTIISIGYSYGCLERKKKRGWEVREEFVRQDGGCGMVVAQGRTVSVRWRGKGVICSVYKERYAIHVSK